MKVVSLFKEKTMTIDKDNMQKTPNTSGIQTFKSMSLLASRALSVVFTPFYLPLVGMMALFIFSYLSLLSWSYKFSVLFMVYIFTILVPTMLIHLYRKYQGWSVLRLLSREGRMVPYIISIMSYFTCFYLMKRLHFPHFMSSIVVSALFIQIICAIVNVWFKVSTHTAAIGGITGGLLAFAEIFVFNPLWWLCILLLLAGLVGTGRMILRQHSLHQVVYGYLIGTIVSFLVVIMI